MKYITNLFRVGCVALLAMLILAPGAFAQQDPPTPPAAPTDLEARAGAADETTGEQHGRITLTWEQVPEADNGGFAVTDYIIEFSSDYDAADPDAATWTTVDVTETAPTTPATEYTATHILPEEADGDAATASYNLERHYRVRAVNVIGEGDNSTVAMATTHNVPNAPSNFVAVPTPDAAASITITWDPVAPAYEGALPVAETADGYRLEFTTDLTADPVAWTEVTIDRVPDATATPAIENFGATHVIAGEDPGTTRHYRVKAFNAASPEASDGAGGGDYSTDEATTHDVPDAPTALTVGEVMAGSGNPDAVNADQNHIPLSWTAPADNGGLPITEYQVQFLTDATGAQWATVNAENVMVGTDTTHNALEEADPALTYYYRVRAINAASPTAFADADQDEWSAVTAGVLLDTLSAPTGLIARAVDQQESIDLFWTAPTKENAPGVTGYRIERMSSVPNPADPANPTVVDWADLEVNYSGRSYRDRNLTAGGTYSYRVSAINVVGTGTASEAVSAVSSNKALMPRNLVATRADDMMSIVLTWDGPIADEDNPADGGSTITGYQIEVDDGTGWAVVPFAENVSEHPVSGLITSAPGSEFTFTHGDVEGGYGDVDEGTTYTYRVSAVNDAGPGHASDVATASIDAVAPGAPTGLTATADMDAPSITLMWAAPADNGGAEITSWKIDSTRVANPVEDDWGEVMGLTVTDPDPMADPPTTMYSATHAGLNAGATYYYRVSATNSVDTGDPSNVDMATAADIPNKPTGLTATADGENTINLSWTAPAPNGGSDITGYMIESSPDGTDDSWTELVASQTELTYEHTGLDAGTTVHYRVSAMNAAGRTGAASDPANATTAARGIVMRYAVSEDGSDSGTCTSSTDPCTLQAALDASGASDNDLILVRIRRASETATIGDDVTIGKMVTVGVYVRGASAAAKGAVSFTGSVAMTDGGDLMAHKDASLHFDELEISGMSSIDKLTIGDDLTISEDDEDNSVTSVLAVDELSVSSGKTLTLGDGADVRVRLTKGAVGKMNGKFDVKGAIDGGGDLWIAHTAGERAATEFMLHEPGDYQPNTAIAPSRVKFTVDDCLMVTGGGTVENDLHFVAAGNVCVLLGEVGNLNAVGSIAGQDDITTDVIFRNGVTVNGDVMQWNDARVLFESSSTIEGDATLEYGDGGVGTDFGTPISATDDFVRAMGSGLEFGGASNTIEGDLELIFDGESGSTEVFLNVPMSGGYHMSTVEGDLVIEDGGGIRLHGHPGVRTDRNNNPRAHNLSVEGDVFAYADATTITMEHAAVSTIVGDGLLCSAPGLKFGTKVMLEGDVVFTEGATLTIPTVVIADDVEVEEEGTLIATTVYVTEDGELDSADENVEITDALVLEGDGLEGSLAAGSTVNNLTYATVDSDEIDLGAATVTRLSMNVGADKELRISEAVTVTNLGLCSGTMVLIDTDTDENTLTVTDLLTVMDGHLGLDSNRPGNAGTDIPKENEDRTADHSYILKYVTAGERTADLEWFGGANAPRKLAVDHADAVIIANEAKSLAEGIHIFKGHLHMKGEDSHLTIGPSGLYDANPAGGPFLVVDTGELHSNGNNVQVHGVVMVATSVRQVGKIATDGGELHVLGMTTSKNLDNASAAATLGSVKVGSHPGGVGTIDVGDGALQLGPEAMNPKDGLHGDYHYPITNADARPHVKLDVIGGSMVTGMIRVPSGSKQTEVIGVSFDAIVFDGTKTPNKNRVTGANPENWDGTLYVIDADKNVTVDSLGASNGAVEFHGTKATVNKDVAASSVAIYQELKTLDFKGDLAISGTGGFSSRGGAPDNRRSLMIGGDYSQETTQTRPIFLHEPMGGSYLSENTDKTVMGSFMTYGTGHATRYSTQSGTSLTVKGDFNFGLTLAGYVLNADLEFSGKESQMVSSAVDLGDVLVNNSKGLVLTDSVSQAASSMLTLTSGVISTDSASTWMVKNTGIEEDVRGRNNALTTCDDDENCASVITGGSRRAHMTAGVSRYVMKGNSGAGEMSGGYVFPVGGMSGDRAHYRPLILQLEDDLSEAMPVTVTPMMAYEDPGEINILVPVQGGSLTLNAYADMFWKVETKEVPDLNPHIRIAASGLANVFDDSRLRMVQWDCDWSNARLAGMQIIGSDNTSFAENGYVNGVLNITQQSVEVGTCAILGVASNGIENPIHMDPLTGGIARIQFIHNLPLPFPVDLFLDGVKLMGGLNFQSATGYGHYAAGDHLITVNPVVPPGVVAPPIEIPLPSLMNEQNYAVIAHGSVANPSVKILHTKLRSSVDNMVEAILVHGSGDLGEVDVRILDPADNMTPTKMLANNFGFDSATRYISLAPGAHNVQVTSPDNRTEVEVYYVDLNGYQGETLILNLSGGMDDLGFMGVRNNGDVFLSQVVTGVEEEGNPEIPTEFALHGNYPNPFNPSTRIEFDLPESAQVSLQIVDMLGRQVMTLPAQQVEAGANRTLELNATNLASGHYLYRIIATGVDSRYVKTGRMTLVK